MDDFNSSKKLQEQQSKAMTPRLALAILSSVLGMISFGYSVSVINAPEAVIRSFYNETWMSRHGRPIPNDTVTLIWAFTVAVTAVGGMVGGVIAGWWADKFGRRGGMLVNSASGIVAGVLMAFSKLAGSFEMLMAGRLLLGLHCGLMTGLSPIFTAEVSPDRIRGGVGTLNQLATTVGILLSQALGLSAVMGTERLWPVLMGLTVAPPLLQLILLPLSPESPRYLYLTAGREEDAIRALMVLRGTSKRDDVMDELEQMREEQRNEQSEQKMTTWQVLSARALRMPLIIMTVMHISQQLSGVNIIFFYSTGLFINVGMEEETAQFATMAVGGIMVTMTLVSIPLMDRAGRRTLHLTGLGGMFVFSIVFTVAYTLADREEWLTYLSVVAALVFIVFFAIGPGSIPWMIAPELFTTGPRAAAVSIGLVVNWLSSFAVGQSFPPMQEAMQSYVFLPFTAVLALTFIFLFKFLPETKNKTTDEIAAMFNKNTEESQEPLDEKPKRPDSGPVKLAANGIAEVVANGVTSSTPDAANEISASHAITETTGPQQLKEGTVGVVTDVTHL